MNNAGYTLILVIISFMLGYLFQRNNCEKLINRDNEQQKEQIKTLDNMSRAYVDNHNYNEFKQLHNEKLQVHKDTTATKRIDAQAKRIRELALQVVSLQDYIIELNKSCP